MGTIQIDGSTPKITVGNATAEDATILFDGNAQDFYIALDDSADDLLIGLGSTVGTTPIISMDENKKVSLAADLDVTTVATAATFEPDGDTASGDNAAIGYTSAEGLILTGQGSTSDVTLKNDADGTVFTVPTGTDDILFPDSAKAMLGAASDMTLYHDGTNSYITNAVGALKIATETSGIALTIGHTTSEVTIGDNLTTTGTLTVGSTGITTNGITGFTQWRMSSNLADGADPISANLESVDTDGYGQLGSDMTVSSGLWTFPTTGMWWVRAQGNVYLNGDSRHQHLAIYTTTDNSTYAMAATGYSFIQQTESNTTQANMSCDFIFDVTNTTNCKVKFAFENVSNSSVILEGGSSNNSTWFTFIRLGDT